MRIVILGGGKVGSYLATVLLRRGNEVSVIEENKRTADLLSATLEGSYMVICGDGCDSRYQEDAGIRQADVFVAVTGQDANNLVACEVAQRVFHVPRVIARVNSPKNLRIFRNLDIESISSTAYIATLIEEEALLGSMSVASSLIQGNVMFSEITVPQMHHHSDSQGVKVGAISLPKNAIIVAVSSGDDIEVVNERSVLRPGDRAILVADTDVLDDARAVFKSL